MLQLHALPYNTNTLHYGGRVVGCHLHASYIWGERQTLKLALDLCGYNQRHDEVLCIIEIVTDNMCILVDSSKQYNFLQAKLAQTFHQTLSLYMWHCSHRTKTSVIVKLTVCFAKLWDMQQDQVKKWSSYIATVNLLKMWRIMVMMWIWS